MPKRTFDEFLKDSEPELQQALLKHQVEWLKESRANERNDALKSLVLTLKGRGFDLDEITEMYKSL